MTTILVRQVFFTNPLLSYAMSVNPCSKKRKLLNSEHGFKKKIDWLIYFVFLVHFRSRREAHCINRPLSKRTGSHREDGFNQYTAPTYPTSLLFVKWKVLSL